jgi:hypothetical protein
MTTTTNGKPAVCEVDGCHSRVQGQGLCRVHYDQSRYLETTGRSPDIEAAAAWEDAVESELRFGCVPSWQSPHGTGSMFAFEDERRRAWEARRDQLMAEYATRRLPGSRPWAWWHYEAGRPQRLEPYPLEGAKWFEGTVEERADAVDEYEIEPLVFLASRGELREDELEVLEAEAEEARPRIGTGHEQIGSGGVDRADQRRVKLWEAVRAALPAESEAA